jgi:hypothetical protein
MPVANRNSVFIPVYVKWVGKTDNNIKV